MSVIQMTAGRIVKFGLGTAMVAMLVAGVVIGLVPGAKDLERFNDYQALFGVVAGIVGVVWKLGRVAQ